MSKQFFCSELNDYIEGNIPEINENTGNIEVEESMTVDKSATTQRKLVIKRCL